MAQRREQLVLTQSEIAAIVGMTQPAVCRKLRRGMSVAQIFDEAKYRREMEADGMDRR